MQFTKKTVSIIVAVFGVLALAGVMVGVFVGGASNSSGSSGSNSGQNKNTQQVEDKVSLAPSTEPSPVEDDFEEEYGGYISSTDCFFNNTDELNPAFDLTFSEEVKCVLNDYNFEARQVKTTGQLQFPIESLAHTEFSLYAEYNSEECSNFIKSVKCSV